MCCLYKYRWPQVSVCSSFDHWRMSEICLRKAHHSMCTWNRLFVVYLLYLSQEMVTQVALVTIFRIMLIRTRLAHAMSILIVLVNNYEFCTQTISTFYQWLRFCSCYRYLLCALQTCARRAETGNDHVLKLATLYRVKQMFCSCPRAGHADVQNIWLSKKLCSNLDKTRSSKATAAISFDIYRPRRTPAP